MALMKGGPTSKYYGKTVEYVFGEDKDYLLKYVWMKMDKKWDNYGEVLSCLQRLGFLEYLQTSVLKKREDFYSEKLERLQEAYDLVLHCYNNNIEIKKEKFEENSYLKSAYRSYRTRINVLGDTPKKSLRELGISLKVDLADTTTYYKTWMSVRELSELKCFKELKYLADKET